MTHEIWQPDYRHIVDAVRNRRPARLPLYEHQIDAPVIMGAVLGTDMTAPQNGNVADWCDWVGKVCGFWREMTYDTVSFECGICPILPDHGAIMGGRPGPIQTREDFERYPWADLPRLFWEAYEAPLAALEVRMPAGMKAVGGCGNGVFEVSEDLVGYEYLCMLQFDDPELFADLCARIGDLMETLWAELLRRYGEAFAVCRMGDDLGFKSSTLMAPDVLIRQVVPQYRRVIERVHAAGKPFLWHSCGCIFPVMDAVIGAGIDAKHSNEDQIAPYERWIDDYSRRIGLLGGIDVNDLCLHTPAEITGIVFEKGRRFRAAAQGYALGSGNSIPDYVPVENFLAMVEAAKKIRRDEQ